MEYAELKDQANPPKPSQETVRLQIWDTAGQERFRGIASSYYRLCLGVVVVYDISNKESFSNLDEWFDEVLTYADENVEIVLVGNKSDLVAQREVLVEEGVDFARKRSIPFYETSAYDNSNQQIDVMFQELCQRIILNSHLQSKISSTLMGSSSRRNTKRGKVLELKNEDEERSRRRACCS